MDSNMQSPSGLAAVAASGAVNKINFTGVEASGEVTYEIWRRHGDTVDWYLHATTSDPAYEDTDVKPGQYYEYKIRAVQGESASEYSDSAVVYGK